MRPILPIALLLLPCACSTTRPTDTATVEDDVVHGRFEQALRTASKLRAEHPGDPRYDKLHRDASVAYLLEHGRRHTFKDRDEEAMAAFGQALALKPDSQEAAVWIAKTRGKMSRTWLERGLELHASGKLDAAVDAYENSLRYAPGDPSALNGLGEAVIQVNWRAGMGQGYFEDGLRALSQYWLEQARSRFAYSGKYQPEDARTKQRRGQSESLLAHQRLAVGKSLEAAGKYSAARNEYRFAAALDPGNAEAKEGIERCLKESRAVELLSAVRMEIVRGRFEKAESLIEEGLAVTIAQTEMFEGARAQVQEARLEKLYQAALTLERDSRYEEAIVKYGELLAQGDYYKDALARRDVLAEYVKLAGDLHARARDAATDAERLDLLRQIRAFWPEYKDVADQLRALERPKP